MITNPYWDAIKDRVVHQPAILGEHLVDGLRLRAEQGGE